MESFLSLFIFHDSYVVSFLVVGITIIVVMLLLFNQKSPESVVQSEIEGGAGGASSEEIAGALRRVLGENEWSGGGSGGGEAVGAQELKALEDEVLEKDKMIADLNTQLTQGGGGGGDDSALKEKIAELEARLEEYEIIEDDIADLSLYRTENDKLKEELERLKSQLGSGASEPSSGEVQVAEVDSAGEADLGSAQQVSSEPEPEGKTQLDDSIEAMSEDLVAEFEKIVDDQEDMKQNEGAATQVVKGEGDGTGDVLLADQIDGEKSADSGEVTMPEPEVHPKLANVNPDSKEEAEVFISDLKSLKKGS